MKKILGIFGLLVFVCVVTALAEADSFLNAYNLQNLVRWTSLFGIISIGVAFVIITGGIDLSIGSSSAWSARCCRGCSRSKGWSVPAALAAVLLVSLGIGLAHGLLITKMRLQPFVVTLVRPADLPRPRALSSPTIRPRASATSSKDCARWPSAKSPCRSSATFAIPVPFFILLVVAVLAAVFLNRTI